MNRHILLFFLILCFLTGLYFIAADYSDTLYANTRVDSVGHFIGFFCLGWIFSSLLKIPLFSTCVCLSFYAVFSEIGQHYLGYRAGEFRDVVADICGILFYAFVKWSYLVYGKKWIR
mgnify:CR=1 FL=1